ncbi:MAG: hypothetical protein KDA57_20210 [Planctomycetales bacterium]|nr:hypothetical protein [Planctomycetales bacterium]
MNTNASQQYPHFLQKLAAEFGYADVWTKLTTAFDRHLFAICEAGQRRRLELSPSELEALTEMEFTLARCQEELREAAKSDVMAHYLLSQSRVADASPMTLHQRFEIARQLRFLAEQWKTEAPEASEMAAAMAEGLAFDLQLFLQLDTETENGLAEKVQELGGFVIPQVWQGWPFPLLNVPLPLRLEESLDYIDALRESGKREEWKNAIIKRRCSNHFQLSFWFPQVIPEDELELPANRVQDVFPELSTSDEWPVIQLQIESPPNSIKHPSIMSMCATYRSFRCNWSDEEFTCEEKADFVCRLRTLQDIFVQLDEWCRSELVELDTFRFCAPKLWHTDAEFRERWHQR